MYRAKKVKDSIIASDGIKCFFDLVTFAACIAAFPFYFSWAPALEWTLWALSAIIAAAGLFVLAFFRNPPRASSAPSQMLLSPADGQVMSISELDEPDFIGGKAVKVTIFLSLFNVHINRSPMEGTVLYHQYREGKMIPAFKSHVSEINERNTIGIEAADGYRILVHQITGFVARRIVWWVEPGETLQRGERFGLIRFGSCTEIVMPAGTKVTVKPGQRTRGGITAIAERDSGITATGERDL